MASTGTSTASRRKSIRLRRTSAVPLRTISTRFILSLATRLRRVISFAVVVLFSKDGAVAVLSATPSVTPLPSPWVMVTVAANW